MTEELTTEDSFDFIDMATTEQTEELVFDDYTVYTETIARKKLWQYIPPVLLVFGTIGNILSIIVLRRKHIRKSVCTIYFIALAISDLLVLYTGLLRQWINIIFSIDIRHVSASFCKIHTLILYFSLDFSAWIQVAVTVERLLVVWFPHGTKYRCSRHTAVASLIIMGFCLLAVNSHILYGFGNSADYLNGTKTVEKCTYVTKDYALFFTSTWPWIYLTVFFMIPFCFLFLGNVLIIIKLIMYKRAIHRHIYPASTTTSTSQPSKLSSMSLTLFTLNTVFLVCNIPISIFMIEYENWRETLRGRAFAVLEMMFAIVNILMYLNNAITFVLYLLSGTKFRRELTSMFCCKK